MMSSLPSSRSPYGHHLAPVFHDRRRRRIGLLGGSFNPAHQGHGHIADLACRKMRLDEIWWLVSPQNPLKPTQGMASFDQRFASAVDIAGDCHHHTAMKVSALEKQLGYRHTALTLKSILRRAPNATFFWIMGADNLAGFHRWHQPHQIAASMSVVVINRPGQTTALGSIGARILGRRLPVGRLARRRSSPRRWSFVHGPLNPLSATAIRAQKNFH